MLKREHYELCRDNVGKAVEIQSHDGQRYHGIIERVDDDNVYLKPIPERQFDGSDRFGGNSFLFAPFPFFFRPFFPFARIYALTFLPFFFW